MNRARDRVMSYKSRAPKDGQSQRTNSVKETGLMMNGGAVTAETRSAKQRRGRSLGNALDDRSPDTLAICLRNAAVPQDQPVLKGSPRRAWTNLPILKGGKRERVS